MDLQKMQNKDMDLALSTDAKPRLKWTPVLHQHFLEALTQLGGAERATPKSLMRVMGIPGLTLYHLKSHLQKYRLGKSQQSECCNDNEQEGYAENESGKTMDTTHVQMDESMHVAQTLQMQMEVQKKLHEQLEVQRHLQLRIESQGLYLQSILKKAQVALAGYNPSPAGLESAKTEVSELVSLVETGCLSSSFPEFTNTGCFGLNDVGKSAMRTTDCSDNSSLTSTESCGRKDGKQPLVEINPSENILCSTDLDYKLVGRKRSGSTIWDESTMEHTVTRIPTPHPYKALKLMKLVPADDLDMNFNHQKSAPGIGEIDLNCAQPEVLDES